MQGRIIIPPKDYETKNRIVEGVDRPITELTVDIICHNSGISRPTFYRHFTSKYELGPWYARFVEAFYLDRIGVDLSWEEGLLGHFELLYEKRDLYYYTSTSEAESIGSIRAMQEHRGEVLLKSLRAKGVEVDEDFAYYVEVYTLVESQMSARWMRNHMDRSPADLARLIAECVPRPLYQALQIA